MKHRMITVTFSAFALSVSAASVAGAQVSFSDNFNSGPSSQWGNQRGGWFVSNGQYDSHNPNNNPATFSLLPYDLTDFSIWVDIAHLQDGGIWLRSRVNQQTNTISDGVLLVTGGRGQTGTGLYWHTIVNGVASGIQNEVTGLFTSGQSNATIRVDVSGDTYAAYVGTNPNAATTLTTAAGQFTDGRTGLYDFSGQTFDNVNVIGQTVTPEPATLALLAPGLAAVIVMRRRRR